MGLGRQFGMGGGGGGEGYLHTRLVQRLVSRAGLPFRCVYTVQIGGLVRETSQRPGTCLILAHAPIVLHSVTLIVC